MTFSNLDSKLDLLAIIRPIASREFERKNGDLALIIERYTDLAVHNRIETLFSAALHDAAWYAQKGDRACIHTAVDAFHVLNRVSDLLSPVAVEVCREVIRHLLRAMRDRRNDTEARSSIKLSIGRLLDDIVENHRIVDILAADDRITRAN